MNETIKQLVDAVRTIHDDQKETNQNIEILATKVFITFFCVFFFKWRTQFIFHRSITLVQIWQ